MSIRHSTLRFVCGMCVSTIQLGCSVPVANLQGPDGSTQTVLSEEPAMYPSASTSTQTGFFTRSQASRGERRFQQLCSECHRTNEITRIWFRGAIYETAGDLMNVISTTMPEGNPGSLGSREYVDILAFLLRLNDYPAGEEELPPDSSLLENVRIPGP